MRAHLETLCHSSSEVIAITEIPIDDISSLLLRSYENTPDWIEGSTINDAKEAIEGAINGQFGTFIPQASGCLVDQNSKPISAIICSIFENEPFIVFTFTDPIHLKKGCASLLIRNAAANFLSEGYSYIHLYVTEANHAIKLYKSLGFTEYLSGEMKDEK